MKSIFDSLWMIAVKFDISLIEQDVPVDSCLTSRSVVTRSSVLKARQNIQNYLLQMTFCSVASHHQHIFNFKMTKHLLPTN